MKIKSYRKILIVSIIVIACFLFFFFVTRVSALSNQEMLTTSPTIASTTFSTPTPTLQSVCSYDVLISRINSLENQITIQSNAYTSTINRWESNLNTILAIVAIATAILAILGFGFVRFSIRKIVEDTLKGILKEDIEKIYDEEQTKVRKEWEPKFTKLYEEYQRTLPPPKK